MKIKKILILSILCFTLHSQAQVKKIYGYHQFVYGGAMLMNDNSEGKPEDKRNMQSVSDQYFIFTETEKNKVIIPKQLWIKRQLYDFTLDTIKQFPFILLSSGRGGDLSKDTLVQPASGCVIQLKDPAQIKQQNVPKSIRKKVRENELVLIYQYKGSIQKKFARHLKQLPPVYNP